MRKKILSLIFILIVLMGGCEASKERRDKSFFGAFDTIITITAYETVSDFDKMIKIAEETLIEYSRHFDRYREFEGINNIKTVNDMAGIEPVKVDAKIIEILDYALLNDDLVNGKVNIGFGAVLNIWHDYREKALNNNPNVPPMELLYEASDHVDTDNIIIDHSKSTVFLKDEKMSLDLGAIAKGYSVEKLVEKLKAEGYNSFLINAGGNVRTVGIPSKNKSEWVVGIQNPDEKTGSLIEEIVRGNNISIVTSGIYQRYYEFKGEKYHHIIDTKTLMPGNNYKSVSIIGEDSGLCDILSTGIFLMELDEAMALINSLEGIEGIFILTDNSKYYSSNIDKYLVEQDN